MKHLNTYITEYIVKKKLDKAIDSEDHYDYFPKTKEELIKNIKECLNFNNYNLNCIDTSAITDMSYLFKNITLPLLSPVTFYILITSLIGGFQVFVEVQVMTTNGGLGYSAAPIVYYLYEKAFESFQLGYASAIAIILAVIIFIITLINFVMQDKWVKTID